MSDGHDLGEAGEDRAARALFALGYTPITRRYRAPHGEIDLVMMDGETLVFIEVKTRRRGSAESAIDERKLHRLADAAAHYLASHGLEGAPFRLDVVAIQGEELRHHRDILSL